MDPKVLQKKRVALAGNPNVGKSTLFNALTGKHRHTGNWSGKTVDLASGLLRRGSKVYEFVDLPGAYSLQGLAEERITGTFLEEAALDCVVVVCDGGALERTLILAIQLLQKQLPVVVCVNFMDEVRSQGIRIHQELLQQELGAPVVLMTAARGQGIDRLLERINQAEAPACPPTGSALEQAQRIAAAAVCYSRPEQPWRVTLDRLLVSRRRGLPIFLCLLFFLVWLTVWGANYPSAWLQSTFDWGYGLLQPVLADWPAPISGLLLEGIYVTTARILAVMLPPMAIFFLLFTLLEEVGYLPRMAMLLDAPLSRCGGCGKQALTMCMGLGCNAVGVTGCRIIDSPRERLLAILTNAMVPCNGRFPALILLAGLCGNAALGGVLVVAAVGLGIAGALLSSAVLSKTALRHETSVFLLELPPLRRPRLGKILREALLERTVQVGLRALTLAAPMGALLWLLQRTGLLEQVAAFFQPAGVLLGMNGALLLGFVCALPANELLIPVTVMALTGQSLQAAAGLPQALSQLSWQSALCAMVFTVFHWPCATTLLTIRRETGSWAQTAAAFCLPTAIGAVLCMALRFILPG